MFTTVTRLLFTMLLLVPHLAFAAIYIDEHKEDDPAFGTIYFQLDLADTKTTFCLKVPAGNVLPEAITFYHYYGTSDFTRTDLHCESSQTHIWTHTYQSTNCVPGLEFYEGYFAATTVGLVRGEYEWAIVADEVYPWDDVATQTVTPGPPFHIDLNGTDDGTDIIVHHTDLTSYTLLFDDRTTITAGTEAHGHILIILEDVKNEGLLIHNPIDECCGGYYVEEENRTDLHLYLETPEPSLEMYVDLIKRVRYYNVDGVDELTTKTIRVYLYEDLPDYTFNYSLPATVEVVLTPTTPLVVDLDGEDGIGYSVVREWDRQSNYFPVMPDARIAATTCPSTPAILTSATITIVNPSTAGEVLIRRGEPCGLPVQYWNEGTDQVTITSEGASVSDFECALHSLHMVWPGPGAPSGIRRISVEIQTTHESSLQSFALLKFPTYPGTPATHEGGVLYCGGDILESRFIEANWGRVMARGNIDLFSLEWDLDQMLKMSRLEFAGPSRFIGAGYDSYYDDLPMERWVRYSAGGHIRSPYSTMPISPLFNTGIDTDADGIHELNGREIVDLFSQLHNSTVETGPNAGFGSDWHIGNFSVPQFTVTDPNTSGVYFNVNTANEAIVGSGLLVQGTPLVTEAVDNFLQADMDYSSWKNTAIQQGSYIRPSANGYVGSTGLPLWVTPARHLLSSQHQPPTTERFVNIAQLSKHASVAGSGETAGVSDQVLFVDSPEGTQHGTTTETLISNLSGFFWKGMIYLNGTASIIGGAGFPTLNIRDPAHTMHAIDYVFLHGTFFVRDTMRRHMGDASVYGRVATPTSHRTYDLPRMYFDAGKHSAVPLPVALSAFEVE